MPRNDNKLARAKACIAEGNAKYAEAARLIREWLAEDPRRTQQQAADGMGKHVSTVERILASFPAPGAGISDDDHDPQMDWQRGSHATSEEITAGASTVLRDPARRREALGRLSPEERAEVVAEALDDRPTREAVNRDDRAAENVHRTSHEMIEARPRGPEIAPQPRDWGWRAGRWIMDATFLLWRAQNRLLDEAPPTEEWRQNVLTLVAGAKQHLERIEERVGGTAEDLDLAAAVAAWEVEFAAREGRE